MGGGVEGRSCSTQCNQIVLCCCYPSLVLFNYVLLKFRVIFFMYLWPTSALNRFMPILFIFAHGFEFTGRFTLEGGLI
jgi:hypothetical protein